MHVTLVLDRIKELDSLIQNLVKQVRENDMAALSSKESMDIIGNLSAYKNYLQKKINEATIDFD